MTTTPLLSIRGLRKSFGTKAVLKGIDLEIAPGESLVVIGGSGSGKSVLLKCILGLLPSDGGHILFKGQELLGCSRQTLADVRRQISMLFQGSALFDSLPVWENISFVMLQERTLSRTDARALAIEKLAAVGLPHAVADLYPAELSGGMQRRVALARTVAPNPSVIFFDEPTTGLDPIMGNIINTLIRKSVTDLGATAITITHDMASARKIADRIAMIYQGQIVWQGPVSQIDDSGNPYIDQFIHGLSEGPIQMDVR